MACDSIQKDVNGFPITWSEQNQPAWQPMPYVYPSPGYIYTSPGYYPNPPVQQQQHGWICSKCGRSWAPNQLQCYPCNNEVEQKKTTEQIQAQVKLLYE